MRLPEDRGPLSGAVSAALRRPPGSVDPTSGVARGPTADPLLDEDLQLALWTCYELHYRSFDDVDDGWEWNPSLLALRAQLEAHHEAGLATRVPRPVNVDPDEVPAALAALVEADDGPAVGLHLLRDGTLEQFRDMVVHRSVFQLKEADPHTWAIPRLDGRAKAALVEVQADEYGGGQPGLVHQQLFRDVLRALDLDDTYGHYVDAVPAPTLAASNTQSLFGLHRRWLGAICGHLAAFEMTSAVPNRQFGQALRRYGVADPAATRFFDEHVEADSVHENIAAYDLAGGLAAQEPELAGDIVFGLRALLHCEALFAGQILGAWRKGESSLLSARSEAVSV